MGTVELGVKHLPDVKNRRRTGNIPQGSVYVGRPSKWGNPFKIGLRYQGRILDRQGAVDVHEYWLLNSEKGLKLMGDIGELRGKDLVCWCSPLPCHAYTLLREANG